MIKSTASSPAEQVKAALAGLPVRTLLNASVSKREVPDLSNPGGYYDRWVLLEYKGWFGTKRTKVIYFEQTATDEFGQHKAYAYAQGVVAAVNSIH